MSGRSYADIPRSLLRMGMCRMRARYYSTDLKRFINEDPEKDRINWYTYGYSNPLNYIDPEGTIAPAVLVVVGVINAGLWVHSAYSTYKAIKNRDWAGAAIAAIGLIPGGAFAKIGSKVASKVGPKAAKMAAAAAAKAANSKMGSKIAAAVGGVLRNGGVRASTVVATTAKNTVRTGSQVKTAGSAAGGSLMTGGGGIIGSGLSGLIGPAASAGLSGIRYLLTGNGIDTPRLTGPTEPTDGQLLLPGNTINTPRLAPIIPKVSLNELPANVQKTFNGYNEIGWKGNFNGQSPGTRAGGKFDNVEGVLPLHNSNRRITYREFDVNNKVPFVNRDAERFVYGSDGSIYYTDTHYESFVEILWK